MVPGEKAIYCSTNPNLAGGMLQRIAREPLPQLFDRLVARPMQFSNYALFLSPVGDAYMGGGSYFLPRDFMKLGQLMLNGGTWNGRRILGRSFVERASSPRVTIDKRNYGYLWWIEDYPYRDHKVRAFFAGGNGGQIAMAIPELDLVLAFYGGNYSDATLFTAQNVYVPQWILPAVQ
jgi:CubicO group peptidase (beta-lactamase class C family)